MKTNLTILFAVFLLLTTASCKKCPTVTIPVATEKTITIQPDGTTGNDAFIAYSASTAVTNTTNFGQLKEMDVYAWTSGGQISGRTLISFPFDSIPSGAEIISAKLTVYGAPSSTIAPQGNSGANALYIQRIIGNWSENTVNWNSQPSTSTESQATTTASTTQWNYSITDVDVTTLVKHMRIYPGNTNGFCLRLQNETPYASIIFSSSEADDASKRPKLVVVYKK